MASPEVSADHLHCDTNSTIPVRVKGDEPAMEKIELGVRLCVEESSAMTPSDELHSTDSASFPSLSDDGITDNNITDDVNTTEDITTEGGPSPQPPAWTAEETEGLKTDYSGTAAVDPHSSAFTPSPSTSAPPTGTVSPPTFPEPTTSITTLMSPLSPPHALSLLSVSSAMPPATIVPPPTVVPPPSAVTSAAEVVSQEFYLVKWITWKEKRTPIVTQSQNGPCPLLAIMNTLFLRWKAKLPAQMEVVTTEDLMTHLGECVLSAMPREKSGGEGVKLNFQQEVGHYMTYSYIVNMMHFSGFEWSLIKLQGIL